MTAFAAMLIAVGAGVIALVLHRKDDSFRLHDNQRGWTDVRRRHFFSWPVRFWILVWALALLIGVSQVAHADESPPPSTFTLELWTSMNGFAVARTVGPMTPAQCTRAMPWLKHVDMNVPPNMRRLIGECVPKPTMVAQLAGWNCIGSVRKSVPKHPEAAMWIYGCAAP